MKVVSLQQTLNDFYVLFQQGIEINIALSYCSSGSTSSNFSYKQDPDS